MRVAHREGALMSEWDYVTDLVVVGSGGGLCGAIVADVNRNEALVIEKTEVAGGAQGQGGDGDGGRRALAARQSPDAGGGRPRLLRGGPGILRRRRRRRGSGLVAR